MLCAPICASALLLIASFTHPLPRPTSNCFLTTTWMWFLAALTWFLITPKMDYDHFDDD